MSIKSIGGLYSPMCIEKYCHDIPIKCLYRAVENHLRPPPSFTVLPQESSKFLDNVYTIYQTKYIFSFIAECTTCKTVCAYDGRLENACKCLGKTRTNATDGVTGGKLVFIVSILMGLLLKEPFA